MRPSPCLCLYSFPFPFFFPIADLLVTMSLVANALVGPEEEIKREIDLYAYLVFLYYPLSNRVSVVEKSRGNQLERHGIGSFLLCLFV